MSVASVSVMTRLRTWALIAGLTGLLVGIGVLLGGGFLYLFVGLAVLMNLVGYFFSDRIALKASRARPLEESGSPGAGCATSRPSRRAPCSPTRWPTSATGTSW